MRQKHTEFLLAHLVEQNLTPGELDDLKQHLSHSAELRIQARNLLATHGYLSILLEQASDTDIIVVRFKNRILKAHKKPTVINIIHLFRKPHMIQNLSSVAAVIAFLLMSIFQ